MEFVDRVLPAATVDLITAQLPAVYGEMLTGAGAEWLVRRWLGSSSGLEPVRRWLPHDPTVAMGAELARLARVHAAAGTEPSATETDVREFLEVYGHRAQILVAATTDPGWTPLFLLAGALVTEVGGVVSHGAVVAREYGLPAVAAVADATTRLRTGQRIRVDGNDGTVTVLEPAAPPRSSSGSGAAPCG
ncbi:PEP-utilizing enzyme [Pseudonocardia zijingensis]|uniref:PEP-utilising enzyme mobile domain-containing protein n=1 Tax=Pseudonocardia zijingensis TaxID=153376 RepID=A0ABN1NYF9_9PSEU